jgi:hypothetical protein
VAVHELALLDQRALGGRIRGHQEVEGALARVGGAGCDPKRLLRMTRMRYSVMARSREDSFRTIFLVGTCRLVGDDSPNSRAAGGAPLVGG